MVNRHTYAVHWLELKIDHYGRGPEAIGRSDDGRIVFVNGAVPGDTVRVNIHEEHKTWMRGEVVEVLEPSKHRRDVPCEHHVRDRCGGCPWIATTIECQQEEKQRAVEREIARISTSATVHKIRDDVPEWGYRRRSRLGYRGDVVGFRKFNERRIFDLEQCLVLDTRINAALPEVRAEVAQRTGRHTSGNLDVVVDANGGICIGGKARIFQQPSATTESVLIQLVLDAIPDTSAGVGELFAGAGTFTEPLMQQGHRVTAWEVDRKSVDALRQRCPKVTVHQLDLFKHASRLDLTRLDAIILDPPRAGAKACIQPIVESDANRIVYVSCDLATLCRDLRSLQNNGFRLQYVTPIDAFPQTPHIECVAVLDR